MWSKREGGEGGDGVMGNNSGGGYKMLISGLTRVKDVFNLTELNVFQSKAIVSMDRYAII